MVYYYDSQGNMFEMNRAGVMSAFKRAGKRRMEINLTN